MTGSQKSEQNTRQKDCPFCSGDNTRAFISMLLPTILSACTCEEARTSKIFRFEASLCLDCGLGYNSMPLPDHVLADIYRNYHYIRPQKGIGTTKYEAMIKCLQRHTSKEQHLVEIGSSDGYLIDLLVACGYHNIEGIEPSKEGVLAQNRHLIRNEFFGDNTQFDRPVDAFFLMHVLEHFSSPAQITALMKKNLTRNGKILFEVPNFGGFHHQHLLFFNRPFVYRLAATTGLSVIDIEDSGPALRVVMQNCDHTATRDEHGQQSIESLLSLAKQAEQRQINIHKELAEFLTAVSGRRVYWWGTGSTSIIALANIPAEQLQKLQLNLIDGDMERKGLNLPISGLEGLAINHPTEIISRFSRNDALVIASSFSSEIIASLQGKCEIPGQIFSINL